MKKRDMEKHLSLSSGVGDLFEKGQEPVRGTETSPRRDATSDFQVKKQ